MEKYELVKNIGSGSFAVAKLMRNKETQELVAMKYIERGHKIDENVAREIMNHKSLLHPNIIRFKEVVLTPTHLAIVMEYAAGGDLFERIYSAGILREDEARNFFQQLISGVSYCHAMGICHRDLKLENTLLDGSPAPCLKICDFRYSESSLLHSTHKSIVGTPAYVAPEVFSGREYDGKMADVWSCGVALYVMLVGVYPFEDPEDPKNWNKTRKRIMDVQYDISDNVPISQDCKHLLSHIFVSSPSQRITINEIKSHPWFLKNLPKELTEAAQAIYYRKGNPGACLQSDEEIMKIVEEARVPPLASRTVSGVGWAGEEEDSDGDLKEEDMEEDDKDEYEKRVKQAQVTQTLSLIRLVVTFLCFFFRLRRIRKRAHTKRMSQRMALSSEQEDSRVLQIITFLDTQVNDVRIVGIHGRDGIGKTTLAKVVYNKISHHFDACSFLVEIEETMQQPGGIQHLQTKLIFDIFKGDYEVASAFKGLRFLKKILRNMKVLLVLDDIENGSLLKEFVGAKLDWFGSGSRIIVTSKERSVLQEFVDRGLAYSYDVNRMDDNQAFDLFWQHAMEKSDKLQPYVEIANKIVEAAGGLPLLLKVVGSFLHDKGREEWIKFKDLIQQFQEDYQKILSIIYEALDQKQKQMYLDIACFLPDMECRFTSYMWHDHDCPHDEIEVLWGMSLIKLEENKISMHSMLRCLAKKIIYEGFCGPLVRVYIPAIAQDTRKRKRGTDLNTEVAGFEILPNMKFFSLGHANIGGELADALMNVRWLHWQGCPQDFEATGIHLEDLVVLDLSWSKVTESWGGWKGIQMKRLKVLNLTGCMDLLVTPSFSCYPNLEILILERCSRLVHLDPSIGDLMLLVTLNLEFCSELSMLPAELDGMNALRELLIDGTSIRELPKSIGKLVRLQILSATNCFSLVRLPCSICELKALSVLALDNAKILELPESTGDLWQLRRLSLRDCRELGKLPESIGKLKFSLEELDISGTGISKLPDSTKNLRSLKVLKMDSCFLREFPRDIGELINLEEFHASWCRSLEGAIPSDISKLHRLKELSLRGTRISSLPSEIQSMSGLRTLDLEYCDNLKELPRLPSSFN